MDNHPIPQDVTNFQFRLIGDMTIKQFAYLAAGAILAWIVFSLPVFFLIKFPFAILLAGSGTILAFVPIGGRPADTMLMYFFKAVFSPSQYVYQQTGAAPIPALPEEKTFVEHQSTSDSVKKDENKEKEEKVHFESLPNTLAPIIANPPTKPAAPQVSTAIISPLSAQMVSTPPSTPIATDIAPQESEQQLTQEVSAISKALQEAKKEESDAADKKEAEEAHEKVDHLETELETILTQKQELEKQLLALEKQLAAKKEQVFTPTTAPDKPEETSHVRKIPASQGAAVGTPLMSDVPNLIAGVVKDPRGNVLPNILIEVKDKDNNPVRAFKTNPLGQFASATPILNGTYTIAFEDPQGKQKFDAIEITATGDTMLPLEVISVDAREELRRELFAT